MHRIFYLLLFLALGCGPGKNDAYEGMSLPDCMDDVDNDGDGDFDCDDLDCMGLSICGGEGELDAWYVDGDGDGLSDGLEEQLGTDPEDADSDGDGFDDGEESEANTDPNDDSDFPDGTIPPEDTGSGNTGGGNGNDGGDGGGSTGGANCADDIVFTGNNVGQITQDFTLNDQNGNPVRLYDYCDKAVLLVGAAFW